MKNLVLIMSYLSLSLSTLFYYFVGGQSIYVYLIYGAINALIFTFVIFKKYRSLLTAKSSKSMEEFLFSKESNLLIIQVREDKIQKVSKSVSIFFNKSSAVLKMQKINELFPGLNPEMSEVELSLDNDIKLFKISYKEIEDKSYYILEDMSLIRERNNEVIELRKQVDELCKFKSHFIDNIAKELRSPLNNIVSMSDLLGNSKLDYEQETYVDYIKNSCRQFLSIINDILDFSRIDIENLAFNKKFIRADNFNYNVKNTLLTFTRNTRLKVTFDEGNLPIYVNIDEQILRQILSNVIVNSVKTTTEGFIEIKSNYENNLLIYEITDSGLNLEIDDMNNESFQFGVGIPLVKKLIELMSGEIEIQNLTDGSYIKISIPAESLDFVEHDDITKNIETSLKNMKILVVEDNLINSKVIVKILEKAGALIETAFNGQEAVNKAKESLYDVILMDYQLPELNGPDATKQIREFNDVVSIIALTANTLDEDRKICLLSGMNDFISKPVQPSRLVNIIKRNVA